MTSTRTRERNARARCACSESQLGAVALFGPSKGLCQPTATEHQPHTSTDTQTHPRCVRRHNNVTWDTVNARVRCARCACSESQIGAEALFGPLKRVGQPTASEHQHTQHTLTSVPQTPSVRVPFYFFVVSFMCRRRFRGGPDELACALTPHMECAGALRYLDQEPGMP